MAANYLETINLFAPLVGEGPAQRIAWFALPSRSREFTEQLAAVVTAKATKRFIKLGNAYNTARILAGLPRLSYLT